MIKYFSYILFLFLGLILFFNTSNAKNYKPLYGKTIVIDPGHGGVDPGTVYNDIYEKNINLEISLELEKILKYYGANVIMLRVGDYDLASPNALFRKKSDFDNRISIINNSNADLFVSIHLNYLIDSKYYGPQVFYQRDNIKLAQTIQKELNSIAKSEREIKMIPSDTYMYKKINIEGVLIECGFLSNQYEREKLLSKEYQESITKSIAKAIIYYFT